MTRQTGGGFIGDLDEAFAPPAAGGCCGAPAALSTSETDQAATSCCGSPAAAQEAAQSGCCGQAPAPVDVQVADATSAGCCG
ncbi:hypothetical protein ABZ815_22840 [Nonomuraea sp. NPDC047529]|uniref:hypothetical protein n=1 Tax=Nonomuraea sp. NPDC047529 TaxID=3155623 RepID=UPI0033C40AD2